MINKDFKDFEDNDLQIYQDPNNLSEIYISSTVNDRVEVEGN